MYRFKAKTSYISKGGSTTYSHNFQPPKPYMMARSCAPPSLQLRHRRGRERTRGKTDVCYHNAPVLHMLEATHGRRDRAGRDSTDVLGIAKDAREVVLSFFSAVIDQVTAGFNKQRPGGGFRQISTRGFFQWRTPPWVFPQSVQLRQNRSSLVEFSQI
jgi:hypothetical protein